MWREEKLDSNEIGFWILSPHYGLRINSCDIIMLIILNMPSSWLINSF